MGNRTCLWVSVCISLVSEARVMVLPLHMTKLHFSLRIKTLARVWVPPRDVGAALPAHPSSPTRERSRHLQRVDDQR